MVNNLFIIINYFYAVLSNLYTIMNKLITKKMIFLLIVSKIYMMLKIKLKNRVFLYKALKKMPITTN